MKHIKEIKETLIKINDFIQENNSVNYKIKLLEREVPNLQKLVKKLNTPDVVASLPKKKKKKKKETIWDVKTKIAERNIHKLR